MRHSRRTEIIWTLARREGITWKELVHRFPRKTLDRHLKALITEGLIKKTIEPRLKGQRGRQSTRYIVKDWYSWGCLHMSIPAKKIGDRWFPGKKIQGEKSHIRVLPEWQREYKEYKASLEKKSH